MYMLIAMKNKYSKTNIQPIWKHINYLANFLVFFFFFAPLWTWLWSLWSLVPYISNGFYLCFETKPVYQEYCENYYQRDYNNTGGILYASGRYGNAAGAGRLEK